MKVMVDSSDGDTDSFDTVPGVSEGATLPQYLFYNMSLLRILNVNRSDKKKKLNKKRQEADDIPRVADDIALLAKTPVQAKSLFHSVKQAAKCIGLRVNANKKEYMCFKREVSIFTQSGDPLK